MNEQTVITRYYGATNTVGARIRVTTEKGWRVRPYDYAARDPHEAAIIEIFGPGAILTRDWESTCSTGRQYTVSL